MTKGIAYDQTPLPDLPDGCPLTLKEDMTSICDRYQINESDLMRRAIVEFVTNLNQNPDQTSRHMFI